MKKLLFCIFVLIPNIAMAYEAAKYEVSKIISDEVEIREYEKMVLATIATNAETSQNDNFRALFDFISGENSEEESIKMTIPVFQKSNKKQKIMSFVMPAEFKVSDLPRPNNTNIEFEIIEDAKFIAIRFSGRSTDENFAKYQKILEEDIKKHDISADLTKPINAYYNSPWTLPFLKRNEVLFPMYTKTHL